MKWSEMISFAFTSISGLDNKIFAVSTHWFSAATVNAVLLKLKNFEFH